MFYKTFVRDITRVLFAVSFLWVWYAISSIAPPIIQSMFTADMVSSYASSGERMMLVIGDSTAYGIGASKPEDSTAGRVSTALNLGVENNSRSGARTREMLGQLDRSQHPRYELILMQVGANDVMKFSSIAKTAAELDAALQRATQMSDRVMLLTAGDIGTIPLWPVPLDDIYTLRTIELRDVFMAVAERHGVEYVDLYALPDPFLTDIDRYFTQDTLHPSSDGYAVWSEYILESIHARWPELYEQNLRSISR